MTNIKKQLNWSLSKTRYKGDKRNGNRKIKEKTTRMTQEEID